ncbi:Trehalose 6-phosphate phosphorylase [Chitinispirillum alkaliphilum]|nr:Trehalose 6-phosphate phosphorylase [Chitinispirillum alkaliphilum]
MFKHKQIQIKGLILDLDGVITDTANLHIKAWKQMFDSFLKKKSNEENSPFIEFDPVGDYLKYLDGRPRYEGASAFLSSRGINLPQGSPGDPPGEESVCALANRKNGHYQSLLETDGVKSFPDAEQKIIQWSTKGYKLAVISASKNCRKVLRAADLQKYFPVIIDGYDAIEMNLRGKPEPDVFLAAAKQLGVEPQHSAIVEDAPAGVSAGKRGGFALVIGISRDGESLELLRENGADIVISDFNELSDHIEEF